MTQDNQWFLLRSTEPGATPDIILGGATPTADYSQDYDKVFNQYADFQATNHIYVRAKNLGDDLAIADLAVFVVHLADLPNQGLWTRLHTSDGRSTTNIHADADMVAVNGVPLQWDPDSAPPPNAPYCLIAQISGDGHPSPQVPETVTDKAGFDAWIATQPQLTYLVVTAKPVIVNVEPSFTWEAQIKLANDKPAQLTASLTCTSASAGGAFSYVFEQNDSNGNPIGLGKTDIQIERSFSQNRTVPANFDSKVTIKYFPGPGDDANATFTLQVTVSNADHGGHSIGTSHPTLVAQYQLSFGQSRQNGG